MQDIMLPKACISKINSMCNVFLWKGDLEAHNTARVAWTTVVKPKEQGGLGVKDLQIWNKACCLRLIWLLFFRPDSVWVSWFKEVILKGSLNNFWTTNPSQNYSWLANKLLKLGREAYHLIHLRVQNGRSARFWFDNWSPYGKLEDYLEGGRTQLGITKNATLASLHRNGVWNLPAARTERQVQVLSFITTIQFNAETDYYDWVIEGKTRKKYSTDEVYHLLRGDNDEVPWFKAIWPSRSIPRQSFHAWLVVQNRLPTRDRMISWGIQVSGLCLLCNTNDETRNHLYWGCDYSFELWSLVAGRCRALPERIWEESILQMVSLPPPQSTRSLTLLGWQATIYWIWNERNQRLHANKYRSVDTLFSVIDHQIRNKIQSFRQENPARSSSMMQQWIR